MDRCSLFNIRARPGDQLAHGTFSQQVMRLLAQLGGQLLKSVDEELPQIN